MDPYTRRVYYYETDQMGIVHHSNYIRWMEEARLDYMRKANLAYTIVEDAGIIMPVIAVDCRYKVSAHFDENISIVVKPESFNGVRASYTYQITNEHGVLLATGRSEHCFLDNQTRQPLNLKRRMPEYCMQYERLMAEENK